MFGIQRMDAVTPLFTVIFTQPQVVQLQVVPVFGYYAVHGSYQSRNEVALSLYRDLGFVEASEADGKVTAFLDLRD